MPSINYPVIGGEKELPYYVCGIGIDFCQNNICRREGFQYPQFVLFTNGEGEMILDGKKINLHKNSGFYMPARIPHEYYNTDGDWRSWRINFSGRDTDKLLGSLGFTEPMIFSGFTDTERLMRILRKIFRTMKNDALFGNYYASGFLYEFILEFYKCVNKIPDNSDKITGGLVNVIEFIEKNYMGKISMEQLCRAADMSEAHLCRLFKKHFGMRPIEYLNKKRIQKAKELLTLSYISVESAATSIGFENPSYFSKLFHRYEGCTPSEYKEIHFH